MTTRIARSVLASHINREAVHAFESWVSCVFFCDLWPFRVLTPFEDCLSEIILTPRLLLSFLGFLPHSSCLAWKTKKLKASKFARQMSSLDGLLCPGWGTSCTEKVGISLDLRSRKPSKSVRFRESHCHKPPNLESHVLLRFWNGFLLYHCI